MSKIGYIIKCKDSNCISLETKTYYRKIPPESIKLVENVFLIKFNIYIARNKGFPYKKLITF